MTDRRGGRPWSAPCRAGRVGRPEEVAAAVALPLLGGGGYVNGATLAVDGGLGA
jgi:3-oxoacyl-[acyl-carrier protein] reductase/beta-ketoacyl ACP reductase